MSNNLFKKKSSKKIFVSIIIPTRNSEKYLQTLLLSIKKQKYQKSEVIVADNNSTDSTINIARKFQAVVLPIQGVAPRVCQQRNEGAKIAKGEYLLFLDHDMELSPNFFNVLTNTIEKNKKRPDALYIPEKIVAKSKVLLIARNFEAEFIKNTIVSAVRLIKKTAFLKTKGYDISLSSGPADWDLDIQLKLLKVKFATLRTFLYHHEENLTIWSYIFKKTKYIKGEELYKKKWRGNKDVYENIVVKQYSLRYRIFWVFVEHKKWKTLIKHLGRYSVFLIVKLSLVAVYVYWRKKYVR